MNRNKLVISGSSFLLPGNKAWNDLQKEYDIEFSEYGDWANTLIQAKSGDSLLIVLHLEEQIQSIVLCRIV